MDGVVGIFLAARGGVRRDYAHFVTAPPRATDVPVRTAAVGEALID